MAISMPVISVEADVLVVVGWVIALMAVFFAAQTGVRIVKWAFWSVTDFMGVTELVWGDDGPVRIYTRNGDQV